MTKTIIKACVDRVLPPERLLRAAENAVKENPANVPAFSFSPGVGATPLAPPYMAMLTGKKWKNGRTLCVRFLDGQPLVQAKVERFAHEWSNFANIKFVFRRDPDAEIRISFEQQGSWSFIGVDAMVIPKNEPTMNFGWLQADTPDDECSRVVIHEFGHALACIHEHQSPGSNIPWDKEAVYRYYMGPPNNWSKSEIDLNLFERYGQEVTQFTQFDPSSIMLYPIPNEFTLGDFEVGWNRELSAMDKEFVATIYPKEENPIVEIKIGARPTRAEIGKHGEEDFFNFAVQQKGRYVIQTGGRTDVVMTLFGPDNRTKLVAEDNDSGRWGNARIGAELRPGTYYVLIRHYRPTGTGKYAVSVKAEK
jgi:hypothetical protein